MQQAPLSILLVDDSRVEADVYYKLLTEALSVDIDIAHNGEDAIALLQKKAYALVLLDYEMPKMNGLQTAKCIKTHSEISNTPPIIFLTGTQATDTVISACYQAGAVDFLSKPVNHEVLVAKTQQFIELAERQRALRVAHEDLSKLQERYQLALDATRDGIWDLDLASRQFWCSERFCQLCLSDDEDQSVGLSFFVDWLRASNYDILAFGATSETIEIDLPRRINGEQRYFKIKGKPSYDAKGQVSRLTGTLTDLSEAIEAEQREKQLLARTMASNKVNSILRLAAGISHEFSNLLQVITGQAQLLMMSDAIPPEAQKRLNSIFNAASAAAALTNSLLMYSRQSEYRTQQVDVVAIVQEAVCLLESRLNKDVSLVLQTPETIERILGDRGQLLQLILNLGLNAIHAMPHGGKLEFSVSVDSHPLKDVLGEVQAQPCVCLVVSDEGEGIAAEHLETIFEPFFTTKEVGEGTGLGLSMVQSYVEHFGGDIEVESLPQQGTTFRLYFPMGASAKD